ncbi:MAG: hypothetical protein JJU34_08900 [Lunatimonas sp.]|uniref:PKD domain-containing protein n=1 Tax=Lunatimonas sp. TaxID=2060141 RepID=UPI00263BE321|nr:hypothetical protein [Lunatimonas sp.]MCC5937386.1 hypothetical protein [Lunatimonas sp.]
MTTISRCYRWVTPMLFMLIFVACEEDSIDDRPSTLSLDLPSQVSGWFNEPISLNASASRDAAGLPISYHWEVVSFPGDHFDPKSLDQDRTAIAKFTPMNVGEFVFEVTASTEFEQQKGRIRVIVDAETIIIRSNRIGVVEQWRKTTPEGIPDYRVEGPISLNDTEITVEEGVVIEMAENASLTVNTGSFFHAVGTEDEPITIRGTEQTRGYWSSLRFASGSSNNRLVHVHLSDGGRNRNNDRGMVTFAANARLHIEACRLSNAQNSALELGVVTSRSGLQITHLKNDYKNNERSVYTSASYYHVLDGESDYTGNDIDAIVAIQSGINLTQGSLTWQKLNVPYRTGQITVTTELTLSPGVHLQFGPNTAMLVSGNGTLTAEGTSDEPIRIEGVESRPEEWRGIYFRSENSNLLQHIEIRGAGSSGLTSGAPRASILLRGGKLAIDNATFIDGGNNYAIAYFVSRPDLNMGENISVVNMPEPFTNID